MGMRRIRISVMRSGRRCRTSARPAQRRTGTDGLRLKVRVAGRPGLVKGGDIVSVIAGVPLPLNLMVWPGLAPSAELGALGVRRLSAGPAISRIIWERAAKMAGDFLDTGRSEPMFDQAMPHAQLQGLFADI